jgi:hypothetical protein
MLEFEQKRTFLGKEFRSSGVAGVQELKCCGGEVSRVESSPNGRSDKH